MRLRTEFEGRKYAFTLITDTQCGVVYTATRNEIPCPRLVGIPKDEHLRILTRWPSEEGYAPRQRRWLGQPGSMGGHQPPRLSV